MIGSMFAERGSLESTGNYLLIRSKIAVVIKPNIVDCHVDLCSFTINRFIFPKRLM